MNIHGHKNQIDGLILNEKFWLKCKELAVRKKYKTAERVCENHAAWERAKIRWHKSEIKILRGN